MKPLPQSWFAGSAVKLAPKLLGKIVKKGSCTGIIVETEAYGSDPASHAYRVTKRSAPMRDTYGHWYVYFTYGMHFCANVTCDKEGVGAVLIRAIEPVEGIALMKRRRHVTDIRDLCNGPAKFCKAFGIAGKNNRQPIGGDFAMYDAPALAKKDIGVSGRIGITSGTDLLWRFYIKGNSFVSGLKRGAPSRGRSRSNTVCADAPTSE